MWQDASFMFRGGLVMYPLLFCGIVSVAIMIDRFLAIGAAVQDNRTLLKRVEEHLRAGRAAQALQECEKSQGRVAKVIAGGVRTHHLDHVSIERAMEEIALKEMPVLVERLGVLDTIVTLAPLLGLLGTVTGMISAFHVVGASSGLGNPNAITGGVSEALIATCTGLTIAIVTLPVYNFLSERVKQNVGEMEYRATQLMNLFADLEHTKEKAA